MLYLLFSLYIMEQAAIYNKEYLLRILYRLLSVLRYKVYKKTYFLRPVDKKVKTATIFVVKTRS